VYRGAWHASRERVRASERKRERVSVCIEEHGVHATRGRGERESGRGESDREAQRWQISLLFVCV
jgi:hypothetical protein